jgi:hypothetical protein
VVESLIRAAFLREKERWWGAPVFVSVGEGETGAVKGRKRIFEVIAKAAGGRVEYVYIQNVR